MALRGEGLRSGVTGGTDGDGSGGDAAGGSGRSVRSVSDGMGWRREGLGAGPGFIGREVRGPEDLVDYRCRPSDEQNQAMHMHNPGCPCPIFSWVFPLSKPVGFSKPLPGIRKLGNSKIELPEDELGRLIPPGRDSRRPGLTHSIPSNLQAHRVSSI